ncbi:MAG: hypothetical protein PUA56_01555 [Bacillales bacterium]|nr:hypothetical protein [Bacillales bacterium]
MRGSFKELENVGFLNKVIEGIKDSIDCNIYFFDTLVPMITMYLILCGTIVGLLGVYILMNFFYLKKKR